MLATWSSDNTARNYLHTPHSTPGSDAEQSSVPAAANIEAQFEQFMLQPGNIRPLVRRRTGEVRFEDSEQSYARRRLLEIEKITLKSKQRHAQSSASLADKISHVLHQSVCMQIDQHLDRPATLFSQYIGCATTMAKLFRLLHSGSGSIAQVTPLISSVPWMEQGLIRLVNRSALRRRDAQSNARTVKQLRTALSYLGIDNLAVLVPTLISERVAPASRHGFIKISEQHQAFASASTATAVHLAKHTGQCANSAAVLCMAFNVARAILCHRFFSDFDNVQKAMLSEARQRNAQKQQDILSDITPCARHLQKLIEQKADGLAASLIGVLNLSSDTLNSTALRVADKTTDSEPLAKIIIQARQYAKVRMLYRAGLLTKETGKIALRSQQYPAGSLDLLKSGDIFANPAAVLVSI